VIVWLLSLVICGCDLAAERSQVIESTRLQASHCFSDKFCRPFYFILIFILIFLLLPLVVGIGLCFFLKSLDLAPGIGKCVTSSAAGGLLL
jgi:hypothetical protein